MILGLWCTIPTTTNLSYSSNSNLLALKKKEGQYFASMQLFAFLLFPSLALSLSMSKEPSPCRSPQTFKSQSNSFLVLFGPDCWKRCVLVVVGIYIYIYIYCGRWILKTLKSNKKHKSCLRLSNFHCLYFVLCSLFRAKSFTQLFVSTIVPQTRHTFCSTNMKALNNGKFLAISLDVTRAAVCQEYGSPDLTHFLHHKPWRIFSWE